MNVFLNNAYLQGKVLPFKEANISIATHALHYGTAAFAGLRAYPDSQNSGKIALFRPELHFERLSNSAKLLGYEISPEKISQAIEIFIRSNQSEKPYYIRPLVYTSDLGLAPRIHDIEHDLLIYGLEFGEYLNKNGISCCFSSWTKIPDNSIPARGKISGSYVTACLAKTEAHERGYDEALMLNFAGKISEGSTTNLFLVKINQLITPSVNADILEGITRRSVIEIASDLEIEVIQRDVDKSELFLADEVFMCGTAAKITPVNKIEQYHLPQDKPITKKFVKIFNETCNNQTGKYASWMKYFEAAS